MDDHVQSRRDQNRVAIETITSRMGSAKWQGRAVAMARSKRRPAIEMERSA
jgi:hypothetical protein